MWSIPSLRASPRSENPEKIPCWSSVYLRGNRSNGWHGVLLADLLCELARYELKAEVKQRRPVCPLRAISGSRTRPRRAGSRQLASQCGARC